MFFHRFHLTRDVGGQGLVEYAFILAFIALVILGIMSVIGQSLADQFCTISFELSPKADLSSPCSKPIVKLGPVSAGPNYLNLEVEVNDPDGDPEDPYAAIDRVEFYIDSTSGTPVQTESFYRYCLGGNDGLNPCNNYDSSGLSAGSHTIIVLVHDDEGNIGRMRYKFDI